MAIERSRVAARWATWVCAATLLAGCGKDKAEAPAVEQSLEQEAEPTPEAPTAEGLRGCPLWVASVRAGDAGELVIGRLADERCEGALEALAGQFDGSDYRAPILAAAAKLGPSPAGETIVRAAMKDPRLVEQAAPIAKRWGLTGAPPALAEALLSPTATDRPAILREMRAAGAEPGVDVLLKLLAMTPEAAGGLETHAAAIEALARVEWAGRPAGERAAAVEALVVALFLEDSQRRNVRQAARYALWAIGPEAAPAVVRVFQKGSAVLEAAGVPGWRIRQGPALVEVLWDLGARAASPAIVSEIGTPLDPPPADVARLPEDQRGDWKTTNSNRLLVSMLAVGALPHDEAVRPAVEVLSREAPPPDPRVFATASSALGLMGTDASRAALWALFREGGPLAELESRRATLKSEVEALPRGSAERTAKMREHDELYDRGTSLASTRANLVSSLALGLGPDGVAPFAAEVLSAPKGPLQVAARRPLPRACYAIVQQCGGDVACFAGRLREATRSVDALIAAVDAATQRLTDEKRRLRDAVKPIGERIRLQEAAIREKLEATMAVKRRIEEIDKLPRAEQAALQAERNGVVERFNTGVDEYNAMRDALDVLHRERTALLAGVDAFERAVLDTLVAIHRIEKAALMIGQLSGGAAHVAAVTGLFEAARAPRYYQLRHFLLVSLERVATARHAGDVEALLSAVRRQDDDEDSFWTMRLHALLTRLDAARARALLADGSFAVRAATPAPPLSPGQTVVGLAGSAGELVSGHAIGGMGFVGTGTGGGGLGGYGRIHGLGKIDTGGGTGMHGSLGRKRARRVGKIRIGAGRSTGFCKKGDIARVVRRRANSIRACYEQRLQVNPEIKGKVTARWTIGINGRVTSASIASSSLDDGAAQSCILRVIRRMSFTRPEGGVCIVQWPFVFNPGG